MEIAASREQAAAQLRALLARGRTLMLGIGNTLREDDGIGPYFVSLCGRRPDLVRYDCGEAPELYAGKALNDSFDLILLVDAVDFGGRPGDIRLLRGRALAAPGISTHDMSPALLIGYLEQHTAATVALLAFQPGASRLGAALSPALRKSAQRLVRELELDAKRTENHRERT